MTDQEITEEEIESQAKAIYGAAQKLCDLLGESNLTGHGEMDALAMAAAVKVRAYGQQKGNSEEEVMEAFLKSFSYLFPHWEFRVASKEETL